MSNYIIIKPVSHFHFFNQAETIRVEFLKTTLFLCLTLQVGLMPKF